MVMRSLLCFWTLFFNVITAEFQPKVTKTTIDDPGCLTIFDNSTAQLKVQGESLFISSDNGVNWEKSDEIYGDIWGIELDWNYRDSRAVAEVDYALYLTEDQGKHWRKLNLPKLTDGYYELDTHPFEKNYLLLRCEIDDDDGYKDYSYVSNDAGRNFRKIESPISKNLDVICEFACKSRDSVFCSNKELIYCVDRGIHRGYVFYTDDFGKSFKFFDQFKDHMASDIKVLGSRILVFTLEDKPNKWSPTNLWVSNDGFTFNKAFLPTALRRPNTWGIIEDELGRIIIPTYSIGMEEEEEEEEEGQQQQQQKQKLQQQQQPSQIFISDPSGLQFHILDIGAEDTLVFSSVTTSKTLKGTMWADLTFKHPDRPGYRSHNKISLDYGNTWSNLRVVRSPGQPRDLFPCDVDDVENCSLELSPFFYLERSQAAGILMTQGSVGKGGKGMFSDHKTMTFISRDGGRSWEVALEYPCLHAFGDGGNIIVAVPFSGYFNDPQGEFYYSLDQGKTWKKYQLDVPIQPLGVTSTTSDGSGLNFIITSFEEEEEEEEADHGITTDEGYLLYTIYTIDFTGVFNGRVCGPEDFEHWYLAGGECVNGAKYYYSRIKQDSQCLVHKSSEDLSLREEACDQCTRKDYECSFGFMEDINGVCKPYPKAIAYSSECKDPNKTSVKLKPMNKLPGNKCVKEMEIEPVEVPCDIAGQISTAGNKFKSKTQLYQYFDAKKEESFSAAEDEVYISDSSG